MISPADRGYIAETFDGALCTGQVAPADGEIYLCGVHIRFPQLITNVHVIVGVAGATMTASFLGLCTGAGARLGVTADIKASLESTGHKTFALTSPVRVDPGWHYIEILSGGGGTDCQLNRGGAPTVPNFNGNITDISKLRYGTHNAGSQSSIPATVTPEAAGAINFWAAVS